MLSTKIVQHSSDEFLKQAVAIALHYGFMPVKRVAAEVQRTHKGLSQKTSRRPHTPRSAFDLHTGELHTALQTYLDSYFNILPQPVLFFHSSDESKGTKTLKPNDSVLLSLQVIGSRKSIAEATIIKTVFDILDEAKISNTRIHINTIGDRDSIARYSQELIVYFRKNIDDMPAHARSVLKKDPLLCLSSLSRKAHPLADTAPRSMEFLSENSRKHLREVLEYLETVGIPYVIDNTLVGQKDCYSQTVFEIREATNDDNENAVDQIVYARGGRYDEFSRKLYHLDIPAVGVILETRRGSKNNHSVLNPKRIRQPKVYFILFGFEAKLRSLTILEMLRKAKVPISQSIGSDKLTQQLEYAEQMKIPYAIIMGQKEALEGSVIVRNMKTRSQETVPVDTLPEYLKKVSL